VQVWRIFAVCLQILHARFPRPRRCVDFSSEFALRRQCFAAWRLGLKGLLVFVGLLAVIGGSYVGHFAGTHASAPDGAPEGGEAGSGDKVVGAKKFVVKQVRVKLLAGVQRESDCSS